MTVDRELVERRLDEVVDPCSAANGTDLGLVEMGLVADIEIESAHVTVSLRLTSPFCMQIPYFVDEVEGKVGGLDGVSSVTLETDQGMEWHQGMMADSARARREERKAARIEKLEAESTAPVNES
ncbi:metal-sulfur cluster assembly factor [Salinirussus salinus]|jgi:metal-sulfur cluster biosynthetic enzyme|uniref:metal-sulfur cluster assembly factor n=1 Tax=Salinirussus salinus TaxID=1198300 RepID=UPI00135BDF24|nr:iron-sulfur cluster assembly protein [Salinirussus salinus]